jgi:ubiquinone/menaquinone biosynthesis C-methylase UbiE
VTPNPFDPLPRLYDWEHDGYRDDTDFYLTLLRRLGGPVLELACGSGRIMADLSAAGYAVTGLDSSAPMLDAARKRFSQAGVSAELVHGTAQELTSGTTFRTILWPLDGLPLLTERQDQIAALTAARRAIAHDGRLVLDLSNGNLRGAHEPAEETIHQLTADAPDSEGTITKWVIRRPDVANQLDRLKLLYDEIDPEGIVKRTTADLTIRWMSRNEVELLLRLTGWEAEEVYGDYDLSPFAGESERIIVVARPAARASATAPADLVRYRTPSGAPRRIAGEG